MNAEARLQKEKDSPIMQGVFFRVVDQNVLSTVLDIIVNSPMPFLIKVVPIKSRKWSKMHRKFEAMINDVAKHKKLSVAEREEFKKDCKVKWGTVQVRYNHIDGKKAFSIPSIISYSEKELEVVINELDVWCAENKIPLGERG